MATVVVHPVAFRLVDEQLLVWLARPQVETPSASSSGLNGHHSTPLRSVAGESPARLLFEAPDRLPAREIGEQESDTDALERLLATLPFQREIVQRKHCAVFADPGRVARRREIGLISWVLVRSPQTPVAVATPQAGPAGDGATTEHPDGAWVSADHLPALLDDHRAVIEAAYRSLGAEILHDAVTRRVLPRHLLRSAADQLTLASAEGPKPPALFGLLPDPFPLSAIRRFYERLLGTEIDRGNFRRKLVELRPTGILKELPIFQRGVRHRAAQLFTFDAKAWERWAATEEAADDGG
jgi:hypothetical protein